MSRYTITARSREHDTDEAAIIGYDRMLRTYFMQAFPDPETEESALWIGCCLEEYLTLDALTRAASIRGCEVAGITAEMRAAMQGEASRPVGPSVAERLGLAR